MRSRSPILAIFAAITITVTMLHFRDVVLLYPEHTPSSSGFSGITKAFFDETVITAVLKQIDFF